MVMPQKFDAPIPGENLTSDNRNYPWHRPPDIVDYDEAVEFMINKISEPEDLEGIFALMDLGADVVSITTVFLLTAIKQGRVGVDLAIQIAGPVSRYIEIKATNAEVDYELGLEDKDRKPLTPTELKRLLLIAEEESESISDIIPAPPEEPVEGEEEEGLMSAPDEASPEEQAEMLGDVPEEEQLIEEEIV